MEASGHATVGVFLVALFWTAAIIVNILRARAGRELFIRRIPGLTAVDEAAGRSTEMGRPIVYGLGLMGIHITTFASLAILQHIIRVTARLRTRMIVSVCEAPVYPIVEEVVRDTYRSVGEPEQFNADDVRYLPGGQFAWALATMGIIAREKAATCFYFGWYEAESLMLAETGFSVGAIQIAGTDQLHQIPFFVAACDYCVFGEEYFAASAYLSREPVMLGSLVGQDWSKILILTLILLGLISAQMVESGVWVHNPVRFLLDSWSWKHFWQILPRH